MQQLYEADPTFFDNCKVFFDPACGYGGFEQFLGIIYKSAAPRIGLISTLIVDKHRMFSIDGISVNHGNMKIISMVNPKLDDGNIRDPSVCCRFAKCAKAVGGADMVIFDIGDKR